MNKVSLGFLLLLSILLVHFDPIGLKLTLPFFVLPILASKINISKIFVQYIGIYFIVVVYLLIILINYTDSNPLEFTKTFILFTFSFFSHAYFICAKPFSATNSLYRIINFSLIVVALMAFLQWILFILFSSDIFFNPFGPFSYSNQYNLDLIREGNIRVTSFFLEPSFLAFVVLNCALYIFLLRRFNFFHLILVTSTLFFAQSRGGFLFYLIFIFYFGLISKSFGALAKVLLLLLGSVFLIFIISTTDTFSILSYESLLNINSSQFDRVVKGYLIVYDILVNHPFGIPLGHIETYVNNLFGTDGTVFTFFYLLFCYFGFMGFAIIPLIFSIIFFKNSFKNSIFLTIYLLMYFTLTGSVLAPDTYFWGCLFILLFKVNNAKWA